MDLVLGKRRADGRWHSEFVSPVVRELGVDREVAPSKWITLRALRVLKWWTKGGGAGLLTVEQVACGKPIWAGLWRRWGP